jgi:hypothetical protein
LPAALAQSAGAVETAPGEPDRATSRPVVDRSGGRYPGVVIGNGELELHVCLPDSQSGYYRGPRFDWSGHIAQARLGPHTFFGGWRTPHDPTANDHAIGPADEFGMEEPLGYAEAHPGEPFLKIGVGLVRKPDDEAYDFIRDYEIIEPGQWETDSDSRHVTFHQRLSHAGWAYAYSKTIRAQRAPGIFTIERTLENMGDRPIRTNHYCHNFFVLDDRPIGSEYLLRLAFELRLGAVNAAQELAVLGGQDFAFSRELRRGEAYCGNLLGFSETAHNRFEILNTSIRTGVRVVGDAPPIRMVVFAVATSVCVEPFIDTELAPGESRAWTNTYELTA